MQQDRRARWRAQAARNAGLELAHARAGLELAPSITRWGVGYGMGYLLSFSKFPCEMALFPSTEEAHPIRKFNPKAAAERFLPATRYAATL